MEQHQTSWSRKNSVRQLPELFSQSKNLAETGGKWKMYFTFISLSTQWGPTLYFTVRPTLYFMSFERWAVGPHLLLSDSSKARTLFYRSLSGLPAAHTFFWVIPTTPTPKWRWFHCVRCGQEQPYLQTLLYFSSNPSNLVGKVFLCGRSSTKFVEKRDLPNHGQTLQIAEAKQVRKTNQSIILYHFKKKGPKVDPHVSNLKSRWFLIDTA